MTGFLALLRKEILEQRRSRKFLAMVAVFLLVAVLPPVIAYIVFEVKGDPRHASEATEALSFFVSTIGFVLGPLLVILIMMGSLAGERDSGTAAMTLYKPVTRLAFVAAKLVGFMVAIALALGLAGAVFYLLVLLIFGDGGVVRFIGSVAAVAGYLLFVGSIAFFWSSLLRSNIGAGGLALGTWIVMSILLTVPKADRFLPVSTPNWALGILQVDGEGRGDVWPAFLVAMGAATVLSLGAWAIFQRKEL